MHSDWSSQTIPAPSAPTTWFPSIIPIDISVIVIACREVPLTWFPLSIAPDESMTIPCWPPTTVQPSIMLIPLSALNERSMPCV